MSATREVSTENLSETVREFDAQGIHRTGTAVDTASALWLANRLQVHGLKGELIGYPFRRVIPDEPCVVEAGDLTIDGYPMIDSLLPGSGTLVTGKLSLEEDQGSIRLMRIDQHRDEDLLHRIRGGQHKALIVAVEGDEGGFTLLNAWRYRDPYGPPVLQVPIRTWSWLEAAAQSRQPASISVGATHQEVTIFNVRARVPGRNPDIPPLVILTPRSGWWHCAGERGGGLAIWLELARILASAPLERDVIFLATTGHEIGYLGIHLFLEADARLATNATYWLHLGANIGAAGARLIIRTGNQDLMDTVRAVSVERVPGTAFDVSRTPLGEAGVVALYGGRFASLIGAGFPLFHSVNDRWPEACDFPAMAAATEAALAVLRSA